MSGVLKGSGEVCARGSALGPVIQLHRLARMRESASLLQPRRSSSSYLRSRNQRLGENRRLSVPHSAKCICVINYLQAGNAANTFFYWRDGGCEQFRPLLSLTARRAASAERGGCQPHGASGRFWHSKLRVSSRIAFRGWVGDALGRTGANDSSGRHRRSSLARLSEDNDIVGSALLCASRRASAERDSQLPRLLSERLRRRSSHASALCITGAILGSMVPLGAGLAAETFNTALVSQ